MMRSTGPARERIGPMTTTTNTQRAKGDGAAEAAPLHVEHLPIADLHPDPLNPRRIAEGELAALCRSIETFGLVDPILARRHDRRVIAGHQRLIAARRCGLATVPTILIDLSEADARLLNVALNRIGGAWDQDLLARLLIDLQETTARDLTLRVLSDLRAPERGERGAPLTADPMPPASLRSVTAGAGRRAVAAQPAAPIRLLVGERESTGAAHRTRNSTGRRTRNARSRAWGHRAA